MTDQDQQKEEEWKSRFKDFYEKIGLSIGVFVYLDHNKESEDKTFFPSTDKTLPKKEFNGRSEEGEGDDAEGDSIPYQNWAICKSVKKNGLAENEWENFGEVEACMDLLEDVVTGGYKAAKVIEFGSNEGGTESNMKDHFKSAEAAKTFLNNLYEISRNEMHPFIENKIDSEYSIYGKGYEGGEKSEKNCRGYVDYGECVAYQLMWRYMHSFNDNNKYKKTSIEKNVCKLILGKYKLTNKSDLSKSRFPEEKEEERLQKKWLKNGKNEEDWERDINHIFFKCTHHQCANGECADDLHLLAFKNYISNLSKDEELSAQTCVKFRPESIVRHLNGKIDKEAVKAIRNATKNLIDEFGIKTFTELHTKARFPIAPYYYWNAMRKQHQTHLMLPVWRDEDKVSSVGLAGIKPWKEDSTLLPKSIYPILLSDRKLTCRAMVAVGRLLVGNFLYGKQQEQLKRTTSRAAVAAVMGRNMSHNIGSHVLARYATKIAEEEKFTNADTKKNKEDHRTTFLNYLQRRMDFIAEVSTASSGAQQFQALNLGDTLSVLDYKKRQSRIGVLNASPVLLKYISGNDKLRATVELNPNVFTIYFNCPGGEMGAHALYVILENIIRNSARHSNINQKVANNTPLSLAVKGEHSEVIALLLQHNATFDDNCVHVKDKNGWTPLHWAAWKGHKKAVEFLLERNANIINVGVNDNRTPLSLAVKGEHSEVIALLLQHNATFADNCVHVKDKNGWTPLHWAAWKGHKKAVEFLLERGADVDAKTNDNRTPLHLAVQNNHNQAHYGVVKSLQRSGADVNAEDNNGATPFDFAIRQREENAIEFLCKKGGQKGKVVRNVIDRPTDLNSAPSDHQPGKAKNVNAEGKGDTTLLRLATQHERSEAVAFLLEHGAAFDAKDLECNEYVKAKDKNLRTPLHWAAYHRHNEAVEFLLEHKADVDAGDDDGWTPLHLAAREGHKKAVESLLEHKADVDAKTNDGWTPLHLATQEGHKQTVEFLLKQDADVDAKTNDGWTPLHLAAQEGHKQTVEFLLGHDKIVVNAKDKNGATSLDFAIRWKKNQTVKVLHNNGGQKGKVVRNVIDRPTDQNSVLSDHQPGKAKDVNAKNNNGYTLLHWAAQEGCNEAVKFLLEHGVDVDAKNNNGCTPLHLAAQEGHSEAVKFLMECGADVAGDRIEIKIKVEVNTKEDDNFLHLKIIDRQSKLELKKNEEKTENRINYILLKTSLVDETKLDNINKENWGIREMQISAHYLRGLPLENLGRKQDIGVIQAVPEKTPEGEFLAYEICLPKPKRCFLLAPKTTEEKAETEKQAVESEEALAAAFSALKDKEELKKRGIYITTEDQFEDSKNELCKYEFALLPSKKQEDKTLKLPVRTFFYAKNKDIKSKDGNIENLGKINDITNFLKADSSKENIFIEKLHELVWKKYREKWNENKHIKAFAAWGVDLDFLNEGNEEKDNYEHLNMGNFKTTYKEGNIFKEEKNLGLCWIDHAGADHFNPSLYQGFKYRELVSSISPHKRLLEEHRKLLENREGEFKSSPEGIIFSKNELLAAALPRVLVLDERVQSNFDEQHRSIPLKDIWSCAGITVPIPNLENSPNLEAEVDLNAKDAIVTDLNRFLDNKAPEPDFVVIHLTLLEKIKSGSEDSLDSILDLFPTDCVLVLVTGRGLTESGIFSDLEERTDLDIRYLPVSSILEYLTINPSKLALMRALWTAVPIQNIHHNKEKPQ